MLASTSSKLKTLGVLYTDTTGRNLGLLWPAPFPAFGCSKGIQGRPPAARQFGSWRLTPAASAPPPPAHSAGASWHASALLEQKQVYIVTQHSVKWGSSPPSPKTA